MSFLTTFVSNHMHPRTLRLAFTIHLWLLVSFSFLSAQGVLPIRQDGQWGVIDQSGRVVIEPAYDQLGWPGAGSSLVVQQGNQLGLLTPDGQQLLPAKFEDIQILDDSLFAVLDRGSWTVRNLNNEQVVGPGYEQLRRLGNGHIAYLRQGQWGLVRADGRQIIDPQYDRIERLGNGHFMLRKNAAFGFVKADGTIILDAVAETFELDRDSKMVFYKRGGKWGGVAMSERSSFPAKYETYSRLDEHHILLVSGDRLYVFHRTSGKTSELPIGARPIAFTARAVAYRLGNRIGLVETMGRGELPAEYLELQAFTPNLIRARTATGWGLLTKNGQQVLPFSYDYLGPLEDGLALAYSGGLLGAVGANGNELLAPMYTKIEHKDDQIRAYEGEGNGAALTVFTLGSNGELSEATASEQHFRIRVAGRSNDDQSVSQNTSTADDRILPRHEWFYAADEDRWGLRLRGGQEVIPPTFSRILVDKPLGITLVGLPKSTELDFERTTYRATEVFGLLLNEEGKVVTELNLLHLELDDWRAGNELARCIFENGRYGLIDRQGRIKLRDAAYIGPFSEGLAPISLQGQLTGRIGLPAEQSALPAVATFLRSWLSSVVLKDYTAYDQQFAREAQLRCEACTWGYVSAAGQMAIVPHFDKIVAGFRQGRAIVEMETGQGLIDPSGRFVIEPEYEEIRAISGRGSDLVYRLTRATTQYGLIDTLGLMRLAADYKEIGRVSEGWVGRSQGQTWGFQNMNTQQMLPDTFFQTGQFMDGLAPAKLLPGWTLIDEQGSIIWPDQYYDELGNISEGVVWSRQGNMWSLLDLSGKHLFQLNEAIRAFAFEQGVARVETTEGWGLVDKTGQWVLRPKFQFIHPFQDDGVAIVRMEGFGLIDRSGHLLTNKSYKSMAEFSDGLALVQDQHGYGFIDLGGKEVIACKLGPTRPFSEGLAVFQEYGKCGYLNVNGDRVIAPKYSNCLDFNDGLAVVYETMSQAGLIDSKGREVVEPSLNRLLHFQEGRGLVRDTRKGYYFVAQNASLYDGYYDFARPYAHGVAIVGYGNRIGLINHKGISLIRPKYGEISDFEDGFAEVRIDRLFGLANARGQVLLEPTYDYLEPAEDGLLRIESGDRIGYMDYSGRWIWELQD